MGLDLTLFIGEIDDELRCSICTMVLENPVRTPCDHLFCLECIEDSLTTTTICPVDKIPLTNNDLKSICRTVRNLLNKLEMKCNFDSEGCNAIVKLEDLEGHFASCEYNPDARSSNDNLWQDFMQGLINQKEHIDRNGEETERVSNEMIKLRNEQEQLAEIIERCQCHQLSRQPNQFEASTLQQVPNKRRKFSLEAPMTWVTSKNIRRYLDQPDIVETDDKNRFGFVRSFNALEPKNSSFKVQVLNSATQVRTGLNSASFEIGLSFKGDDILYHRTMWLASFGQDGALEIYSEKEHIGPASEVGDIIELGLRFPLNFVNDGNCVVELYISVNERVVAEKQLKMPVDAIYPSIILFDGTTKIKYSGI